MDAVSLKGALLAAASLLAVEPACGQADAPTPSSSVGAQTTSAGYFAPTGAQTTPAADTGSPTPAAEDEGTTGDIVVTAQKRSERLSDVPLSITAVTGEQLTKQGILNVADLERIAPGFTYRLSQYGTPVFTIRGIGFYDEQVAVSPAVTVYTDQAPIPYARMTEGASLDVERVEVLKGPQGTLFGQNSTGGAVNYIAARPGSTYEYGLDGSYGRFDESSIGGFASGPVTDTLGVRVAARYDYRGNWQRSVTRNEGFGRRDFLVGRMLVDWRPTDRLTLSLNVNGWRNNSDIQAGQARGYLPVNPIPPTTAITINTRSRLLAYPFPTRDSNRLADYDVGRSLRRDDDFYQIAGRADYELTNDLSLISISSYARLRSFSPIDTDATNVPAGQIDQVGRIRSFSQELRLEGKTGRLQWIVGGNYQRDRTSDVQDVRLQGSNAELIGISIDGLGLANRQRIRDLAGFLSLEYQLTERLSLQGAIRYTDENRDFEGCASDRGTPAGFRIPLNLAGLNVASGGCFTILPNGASGLYKTQLNQENTSWRGSINWKVTPGSLLYANVTKGYKAGTFGTLPAVSFEQLRPVVQESVTAYEAGFKTSLLDRVADLSGAAFYYDYGDKQIQGFILVPPFGNLPNLVNIPKSRLVGTELNLTLRPVTGLRITAAATYLDSKVRGSALLPSPFGNVVDVQGDSFPAQPKWQLQGDADYEFPVSGTTTAFVGANASWRSSTVSAFGSRSGPPGSQDFFGIDAYGLLDVRAGVEFDRRYRVQLYGRNVTNTKYWNNVTAIYDTYVRLTGFPVTYGISASARF